MNNQIQSNNLIDLGLKPDYGNSLESSETKYREAITRHVNQLLPNRLIDLRKSGLIDERIFLDNYRNGKKGWEVPMRDPLTGEEYFVRTKLDKPSGKWKYLQPKGMKLIPFFPYREDWHAIAKDISRSIIITEGEKKVSKLTQEGYIAISMPGVSAYGSEIFLERLEIIEMSGRIVYLCFDNDIRIKPAVRNALQRFAEILTKQGAIVREIILPTIEELKQKGLI